jgi:glycosyltransferase involved in cell wall biosynthesis
MAKSAHPAGSRSRDARVPAVSLRAIRVLIFHGYLLHGTGSNVYNASLARALARLGHEVHLLCQDRDAGSLDWVAGFGRWTNDRLHVEPGAGTSPPGSVTAYVPEIGGLLPVYVADRYEGFRVKRFAELAEDDLDRYLEANVAAVRDVVKALGGVDAALANHLVMGPAILARAGLGFAAKIHGSALEYTVKPEPARFLPYAREGTDAAAGVLVGSRHTAESLWGAIGDPDLPARTRLGPPGVDTELFRPMAGESPSGRLAELAASVASEEPGGGGAFARDPRAAADAIRHLAAAAGPRVVMVGKLIVSKGVDLLLAAWPLVHRANPGARLLVVGFGEYAPALERLWAALASGDLDQAREIASKGRALEGGEEKPLRMLNAFLAEPDGGYREAARDAGASVAFAGRLEHDEVGRLIPATDALVFPSTFPEAFGMVAAEAAAAGVLPVSAAHSGAAEVSRALAATLPTEIGELVSFPLDDGVVRGIAARLNTWLRLDESTREGARRALVDTASELWGWEGVARGVLAASAGRLEELAPVPTD